MAFNFPLAWVQGVDGIWYEDPSHVMSYLIPVVRDGNSKLEKVTVFLGFSGVNGKGNMVCYDCLSDVGLGYVNKREFMVCAELLLRNVIPGAYNNIEYGKLVPTHHPFKEDVMVTARYVTFDLLCPIPIDKFKFRRLTATQLRGAIFIPERRASVS